MMTKTNNGFHYGGSPYPQQGGYPPQLSLRSSKRRTRLCSSPLRGRYPGRAWTKCWKVRRSDRRGFFKP